VYLQQTHNIMG